MFPSLLLVFSFDTHLDLHQEVPQMLFKSRDVLIQAEQTRYKHLHLSAGDKTVSQKRLSKNRGNN